MVKIQSLLTKNRSLMLACDQGLEHGPTDFNLLNIDPNYIIDIGVKGRYNALIFQHGIAEKYVNNHNKKIPLVIKLNGKTNILKGEPYSPMNCSVKRAAKLGADAVGYTTYLGSEHESKIFQDFSKVVEEAHDYGLPVINWMYPRGKAVKDELSTDMLAYAARTGLELGADILKMKYNNDIDAFRWVTKCAGNAKLMVAGGSKKDERDLLQKTHEIMQTGAVGMAIGRNVWQHDNPMAVTRALKKVIFENSDVDSAMREFD